ncbi:3'-5' exonuclease [Plasticicumulans acidivorans]|uniref:DNA polymerase-3 subunit epsilon n=1 Tax=Plasticicumulans acidivorans TaxID=886464 RepID=A0A317MTC9_9GAMM|nr:3'-5' exonuclease [Plasticicumulans acidivorans]PWV60687.1 DNA polymerase-3 subunit epsilon [Plasticicumulans acidivorans]
MPLPFSQRFRHAPPPEAYAFLHEPDTSGELVCLDCSASSLDPNRARLQSIAAVHLRGNRLLTSQAFVIDVDDGLGHQGEEPLVAVDRLLRFVGPRPLIGYYTEFDHALLGDSIGQLLNGALPNRVIDVSALYHDAARRRARRPGHAIDLRFETIRRALGLPPMLRTSALAHAVMAGLMYLKLNPARA